MSLEIERKFTVAGEAWRAATKSVRIVQAYLTRDARRAVRIRTMDETGWLTIKGLSRGAARTEFDYEIPVHDARQMLHELCLEPLIDKTRYYVPYDGLVWEVDEFHAPCAGLIVAEIELPSIDYAFKRPDWIQKEVTGNPLYYNQNIT